MLLHKSTTQCFAIEHAQIVIVQQRFELFVDSIITFTLYLQWFWGVTKLPRWFRTVVVMSSWRRARWRRWYVCWIEQVDGRCAAVIPTLLLDFRCSRTWRWTSMTWHDSNYMCLVGSWNVSSGTYQSGMDIISYVGVSKLNLNTQNANFVWGIIIQKKFIIFAIPIGYFERYVLMRNVSSMGRGYTMCIHISSLIKVSHLFTI